MHIKKRFIILVLFALFLAGLTLSGSVYAIGGRLNIPDCPDKNGDGIKNDYVPNTACINQKIFNPSVDCEENICVGENPDEDPGLEKFQEINFFNFKARISPQKIPNLISLTITTVLIIFALYALFRGVYVAGVKRPQATSADDAAKVNKELRNIIIGFIIAFSFLLILQFVFDFAKVGVTDFDIKFEDVDEEGPALVIT